MNTAKKSLWISRIIAAVFLVLFFVAAKDKTGFYLFYTLPYGLGLIFLPLSIASLAVGLFSIRQIFPGLVLILIAGALMFLFLYIPDSSPQRMSVTVPDTDTEVIVSLHRYSEASEKDFLTVDVPVIDGVLSRHAVYILPKSDKPLKERDIELVKTGSGIKVLYYGDVVATIKT